MILRCIIISLTNSL